LVRGGVLVLDLVGVAVSVLFLAVSGTWERGSLWGGCVGSYGLGGT
jgi:hypothetical protein